MLPTLSLGNMYAVPNPLFCCCKDQPPVVGNQGGSQFTDEPERTRPPGVNPFLRVSPGPSGASDELTLQDIAGIELEAFDGYRPDAVDQALAEQFDRIELVARQAISSISTTFPLHDSQIGLDLDDAEMLAILIASGLFDDDDCCC